MTAAKRFAVLDSWRGIAACLVALFHLRVQSHVDELGLVRNANLFVDFFFVLSGFVITAGYGERLAGGFGWGRFAVLRFGRLYPLHLATLLAFLALGASSLSAPDALLGLPMHLFLLHGIGVTAPVWANVPSWSISTEFFVYLIFAAAVARLGERTTWALAAAVVVLPALCLVTKGTLDADGLQLVRGLYGFAAGALAWRVFRRLHGRVELGSGAEVVAVLALVSFVSLAGNGPASIAGPLVFALVVLVFAFEGGRPSRLLSCRPLVLLGLLSYSIYMVHYLIARELAGAVKAAVSAGIPVTAYLGVEKWAGDIALAIYLAAVVGASIITFRFVEAPSQAWFRRLAERRMARRALA